MDIIEKWDIQIDNDSNLFFYEGEVILVQNGDDSIFFKKDIENKEELISFLKRNFLLNKKIIQTKYDPVKDSVDNEDVFIEILNKNDESIFLLKEFSFTNKVDVIAKHKYKNHYEGKIIIDATDDIVLESKRMGIKKSFYTVAFSLLIGFSNLALAGEFDDLKQNPVDDEDGISKELPYNSFEHKLIKYKKIVEKNMPNGMTKDDFANVGLESVFDIIKKENKTIKEIEKKDKEISNSLSVSSGNKNESNSIIVKTDLLKGRAKANLDADIVDLEAKANAFNKEKYVAKIKTKKIGDKELNLSGSASISNKKTAQSINLQFGSFTNVLAENKKEKNSSTYNQEYSIKFEFSF